MYDELKKLSVKELAERVKEAFVHESNEEAMLEMLKSGGNCTAEDIKEAEADYGHLEYLTNDEIDWLDKDGLIDFAMEKDLYLE